jgi:4-alpha-glucanotransferase
MHTASKFGHYLPENEKKWIPQGERLMRMMLNHCSMFPIGEDLGIVPPEVRACLSHLGICGTKVMRWERNWDGDKSFIDPKNYAAESMTTVSTHDSETLTLWWKNNPEEASLYAKTFGWNYHPTLEYSQLYHILLASHQSGSLFHINLLQEYLALIPQMTWPNPEDERINLPGIISEKNWSYRFVPSVEKLVQNEGLKQNIQNLVEPLSFD